MTTMEHPPTRQEELVEIVIGRFRESTYPTEHVSVTVNDELDLLIRIPPNPPHFLIEKYDNATDMNRACPSIESINLKKDLRNEGFLSMLVDALGKEPNVECVCLSNVSNESLSAKLTKDGEWDEIKAPFPVDLPGALKSFYKTT